jgi:hypothetical protein
MCKIKSCDGHEEVEDTLREMFCKESIYVCMLMYIFYIILHTDEDRSEVLLPRQESDDPIQHQYCHSHNNWGTVSGFFFKRFSSSKLVIKTVEKPFCDPRLLWEWQYTDMKCAHKLQQHRLEAQNATIVLSKIFCKAPKKKDQNYAVIAWTFWWTQGMKHLILKE